MRPCKHLPVSTCTLEDRPRRNDCVACLVTSVAGNVDLLLNSTKTYNLPLNDAYNAVIAVNRILNARIALGVLLNTGFEKSVEKFKIPDLPKINQGVV